jgi:hypothetical protein|tara:strand:- start:600 stop:806 length:207 start_codon:yes stop_codon:yes gene_type:complete
MDLPYLVIPSTSIAWLVVAIGLGLLLAGRFIAPRRREPVAHNRPDSVQIRDDHLHRMLRRRTTRQAKF